MDTIRTGNFARPGLRNCAQVIRSQNRGPTSEALLYWFFVWPGGGGGENLFNYGHVGSASLCCTR